MIAQPFEVANTLTRRMHKGINTTVDEGQTPVLSLELAHTLRAEGFDASEDGTGRSTPIIPDQLIPIAFDCKDSGRNGFGVGDVAPTLRAMGHKDSRGNAGGQVAALQGMRVRRLTPRECERLQGFPDDYTLIPYTRGKPAADGPRYKALGNSMAVRVMYWIGQRIDAVLA